jgi:hypothetical protein
VGVAPSRLDPACSALTWMSQGQRARYRLSQQALQLAAAIWTAERRHQWFGQDRQRLFWHVPQIGSFPGQPLPLKPSDRGGRTENGMSRGLPLW